MEDGNFTVIKSTLKSFCKSELLIKKINEQVLIANKIIFETWKFANLYILLGHSLKKIDQQFFYKCACCVSRTNQKSKEISDSSFLETMKVYKECYPENHEIPCRTSMSPIINNVCKQMTTDTLNHLELRFYKKLYFYIKCNFPNENTYEICKEIYKKEYTGDNEIVLSFRQKLNNNAITRTSIKNNPDTFINLYKMFLDYNITNGKRLFSLLPTKNTFIPNNICYDKNGFTELLVSLNQKELKRSEISKNISLYFENFLNTKKFETCNKKFRFFYTDGFSVSIVLERTLKINNVKSTINVSESDELVSLDPGCRNTYTFYNETDNTIHFHTNRRYYHESGFNRVNSNIKKLYDRNTEIADIGEIVSCKTTSLEEYLIHLKCILPKAHLVLDFHFEKKFRKWKFTKYILSKKAIESICKKISKKSKITENSNVIVGFGNWSNPGTSVIKGHRRGPVLKVKSELKRWCRVIDVDEYKTSKMCCKCEKEMEKYKYNSESVNSVLRCRNNECGIIIDRDINACKNILKILKAVLKDEERPEAFKRTNIFLRKKKKTCENQDTVKNLEKV